MAKVTEVNTPVSPRPFNHGQLFHYGRDVWITVTGGTSVRLRDGKQDRNVEWATGVLLPPTTIVSLTNE